jgi:hypothetical protein
MDLSYASERFLRAMLSLVSEGKLTDRLESAAFTLSVLEQDDLSSGCSTASDVPNPALPHQRHHRRGPLTAFDQPNPRSSRAIADAMGWPVWSS